MAGAGTPKKVSQRKPSRRSNKKSNRSLADDDDDESSSEDSTVRYEGPKVDDMIGEKYKVLRQLGEGGFGAVFQVVDTKTNEFYAVKVELEKPPPDDPGLQLEGQVLKRLQGYEHILRYVDAGQWGPNKISYLIMELAGPSLESHRKKSADGFLSASTTSRLAIMCLNGIGQMHVAGFLHRDIKPGNYAMGHKGAAARNVFILDFGLVRRYMKDGKVRHQRSSAGFRGSVQYASINAHRNIDLGRCDDYWCWLYSMIHLRTGKLPWRNFNGLRKVGLMKMKATKQELLEGMEKEYNEIYDNLTSLKYGDSPPIGMYKEQIRKIIARLGVSLGEPFDWEIPGKIPAEAKVPDKKSSQLSLPPLIEEKEKIAVGPKIVVDKNVAINVKAAVEKKMADEPKVAVDKKVAPVAKQLPVVK